MRILALLFLIMAGLQAQAQFISIERLIPASEPPASEASNQYMMICFELDNLKRALGYIQHPREFLLNQVGGGDSREIAREDCKLVMPPEGTEGFLVEYYRTYYGNNDPEGEPDQQNESADTFIFSILKLTLPKSGRKRYAAFRIYPGEAFRIVDESPEEAEVFVNHRRQYLEFVNCEVQNSNLGAVAIKRGDALELDCRRLTF